MPCFTYDPVVVFTLLAGAAPAVCVGALARVRAVRVVVCAPQHLQQLVRLQHTRHRQGNVVRGDVALGEGTQHDRKTVR